jgi:transcriptional regulator with XRE-family HTH domain
MATRSIPQNTLGARLLLARQHHADLTLKKLAEMVHIDRETLARWEHDGGRPHPAILREIAEACGVDSDWLITGDDQELSASHCLTALGAAA